MTKHPTIVGLGEILWDVFPDGPKFGGAPANFSCHAAALGGQTFMVGAVGTDELGDSAIAALQRQHVATEYVTRFSDYPTGTVRVKLNRNGHAQYEFGEDEAWDHLDWSDEIADLMRRAGAVCFGTLAERSVTSRQTIQRYVGETPEQSLRVFDVNLRPSYFDDDVIGRSLDLANVLKLNEGELQVLASTYGLSGSTEDQMRQLAQRFDLRLVALTRGEHGAVLMQGDEVSDFPGVEVPVKDTVGAGDVFASAMTLDLLKKHDLQTINRRACRIAAFVCSQSGATPTLPDKVVDISKE